MIKVGDKFIIEAESVMTNKNGVLYGIKGLYPLCISEEGIDGLEKFEEPLPVPMSSIKKAHDKGYEEGLNDAWEAARKLRLSRENDPTMRELREIFDIPINQNDVDILRGFSAKQVIEKFKDYEKKSEEEKIKVGDEAYSEAYGVCVVTGVYNTTCAVTYKNGSNGVLASDNIKKTGRHFDIDGILKAMREG